MMRVLHIAYSLSDTSAAVRFAKMLDSNNIKNQSFLIGRRTKDEFVRKRQVSPNLTNMIGIISHITNMFFEKIFLKNDNDIFSFGLINPIAKFFFQIFFKKNNYDLICIHWGGYNFFPIEILNYNLIGKKSVIFLHDYYYTTGGCHIPMNCPEYNNNCKNCPVSQNDISKKWIQKQKINKNNIISKFNLPIIALSNFSKRFIQVNNYKNVNVIPNTIDNEYFYQELNIATYYKKYENYRKLNLNIPTILIVGIKYTHRNNKGLDILKQTFSYFKNYDVKINIITQGEFVDLSEYGSHTHFDFLKTNELRNLYIISDLTILPSKYETFSQVTLESILCFTPVIAFNLTGPVDIIIDGKTGFLVPPFNSKEFAKAISQNLNFKNNNFITITKSAKITFEKFSNETVFLAFKKFVIDKLYNHEK